MAKSTKHCIYVWESGLVTRRRRIVVELPPGCDAEQLKSVSAHVLDELATQNECTAELEIMRTEHDEVWEQIEVAGPAADDTEAEIVLKYDDDGRLVDTLTGERLPLEE